MEATYSSETSDDIQRTTRRYIPEYITFLNYRCESLKSYPKDCFLQFIKLVYLFMTLSQMDLIICHCGENRNFPRTLHENLRCRFERRQSVQLFSPLKPTGYYMYHSL
jgi:hypothetical protein